MSDANKKYLEELDILVIQIQNSFKCKCPGYKMTNY